MSDDATPAIATTAWVIVQLLLAKLVERKILSLGDVTDLLDGAVEAVTVTASISDQDSNVLKAVKKNIEDIAVSLSGAMVEIS